MLSLKHVVIAEPGNRRSYQPVKSWPSLALHPCGPKHQSSTDGASPHLRGPY